MTEHEWREQMARDIASINTNLANLRSELFGNGSAGICHLSRQERGELFRRVNALEADTNKQKGIMVVIGAAASIVVSAAVEVATKLLGK